MVGNNAWNVFACIFEDFDKSVMRACLLHVFPGIVVYIGLVKHGSLWSMFETT